MEDAIDFELHHPQICCCREDQDLVQDTVTQRASLFWGVWGCKGMRCTVYSLDFLLYKHKTFTPALLLLSVTAEVDEISVTWPQKHFSSILWHKSLLKGYITIIYCLCFYIHVHVITLFVQSSLFPDWGIQQSLIMLKCTIICMFKTSLCRNLLKFTRVQLHHV